MIQSWPNVADIFERHGKIFLNKILYFYNVQVAHIKACEEEELHNQKGWNDSKKLEKMQFQ